MALITCGQMCHCTGTVTLDPPKNVRRGGLIILLGASSLDYGSESPDYDFTRSDDEEETADIGEDDKGERASGSVGRFYTTSSQGSSSSSRNPVNARTEDDETGDFDWSVNLYVRLPEHGSARTSRLLVRGPPEHNLRSAWMSFALEIAASGEDGNGDIATEVSGAIVPPLPPPPPPPSPAEKMFGLETWSDDDESEASSLSIPSPWRKQSAQPAMNPCFNPTY
jgi:hypothetical protein